MRKQWVRMCVAVAVIVSLGALLPEAVFDRIDALDGGDRAAPVLAVRHLIRAVVSLDATARRQATTAWKLRGVPRTVEESERIANRALGANRIEWGCGCPWPTDRVIPVATCGAQTDRNHTGLLSAQWTPIISAATYRDWSGCSAESNSARCRATDRIGQALEREPNNLIPMLRVIVQDRQARPFGKAIAPVRAYGRCAVAVDYARNRIEPLDQFKGAIARRALVLQRQYRLDVPLEVLAEYEHWSQSGPSSESDALSLTALPGERRQTTGHAAAMN